MFGSGKNDATRAFNARGAETKLEYSTDGVNVEGIFLFTENARDSSAANRKHHVLLGASSLEDAVGTNTFHYKGKVHTNPVYRSGDHIVFDSHVSRKGVSQGVEPCKLVLPKPHQGTVIMRTTQASLHTNPGGLVNVVDITGSRFQFEKKAMGNAAAPVAAPVQSLGMGVHGAVAAAPLPVDPSRVVVMPMIKGGIINSHKGGTGSADGQKTALCRSISWMEWITAITKAGILTRTVPIFSASMMETETYQPWKTPGFWFLIDPAGLTPSLEKAAHLAEAFGVPNPVQPFAEGQAPIELEWHTSKKPEDCTFERKWKHMVNKTTDVDCEGNTLVWTLHGKQPETPETAKDVFIRFTARSEVWAHTGITERRSDFSRWRETMGPWIATRANKLVMAVGDTDKTQDRTSTLRNTVVEPDHEDAFAILAGKAPVEGVSKDELADGIWSMNVEMLQIRLREMILEYGVPVSDAFAAQHFADVKRQHGNASKLEHPHFVEFDRDASVTSTLEMHGMLCLSGGDAYCEKYLPTINTAGAVTTPAATNENLKVEFRAMIPSLQGDLTSSLLANLIKEIDGNTMDGDTFVSMFFDNTIPPTPSLAPLIEGFKRDMTNALTQDNLAIYMVFTLSDEVATVKRVEEWVEPRPAVSKVLNRILGAPVEAEKRQAEAGEEESESAKKARIE